MLLEKNTSNLDSKVLIPINRISNIGNKTHRNHANGTTIPRKCICKPITDLDQDCNNNRGAGPRGPDGRFTKSPSKQKKVYIFELDNEPEKPPPERSSPIALDQSDNATVKKITFGRGRPLKLITRGK